MDFNFLKPDTTLVPRQAYLSEWEGLSNICSALLTSFFERTISTQAIGEPYSDNWELKLPDTPLSKEDLTALLGALHADDHEWDANDYGEYPIRELSQGIGKKLMALTLPFPVAESFATDDGVWFIGDTPVANSVYAVTVIRQRIDGLDVETYVSRFLIDSHRLPSPEELICEDYLRKIVGDFLDTEEGRCAYEDTCNDFNWGDVETYIPDEFFAAYGVTHDTSWPGDKVYQCCGTFCILVDQDEQLGKNHYDA